MVRSEGKAAEGRRHDSLQARKQRLETSVSHVPGEQDKSGAAGSARGESSSGSSGEEGTRDQAGAGGLPGQRSFWVSHSVLPRKWGEFGPKWVRLGGICYISLENFCPPWSRHCGFASPGAKHGARGPFPSSPSRNLEEGHVKQTPPCRALLMMLSPMTSSLASKAH